MYVMLDTVDKIKRFCQKVSEVPGDVYLLRGCYVVNAKSLLGVFSLDVSKVCEVKCEKESFDILYEKIKEFEI